MQTKIEALQKEITKHDELYEMNQPIITDSEYDKLYSELVTLEARYPQFRTKGSPTQRIVAVMVDELEKVKHSTPMLSLEKTTTLEGVKKFIDKGHGRLLIQQKLDGLTVVLKYEKGVLVSAVTRGDSETGESVLHSVSQIVNVPKIIPWNGLIEVRTEVILPFEEFKRINVDGKYSNPRNLVSGTVRQLDARIAKDRNLEAYVLEVIQFEGFDTQNDLERLTAISQLGFSIVKTLPCDSTKDIDKILDYISKYNAVIRPNIPYMIDGLVIKFDNLELRNELGYTSKFPKWAIAFKFDSQDAITTLRNIPLQVGKTGQITPVAEFDTVNIGVNINRATLHNFGNIRDKDIRIGDKILIARANDVIPQVIKSFADQRKETLEAFEPPKECPECGGTVEFNGEHLYCQNYDCKPQQIGRLAHFVSRNALNIDGYGEETVALFYEHGFLRTFTDLYTINQYESELLQLPNYGEKKYQKMIKGLEASKMQPLHRVLYSLSIPLIGETASKEISKVYDSMEEIIEAAKEPLSFKMQLLSLKDFGEGMSQSLVDYLQSEKHLAEIQNLLNLGLTMKTEFVKARTDTPISGKTFVITGALSKGRSEFQKEIESLGGKVSGSVSKRTDYLLMGPDAAGSTKHTKSIELGVEIISETEYYSLLK